MKTFLGKVVALVIMQGYVCNTLYSTEEDISSSIDDSISTSKPKQSLTREETTHRFNQFFKCGWDEEAKRNAIEQRVWEYLAAGGNPNLCNEFGTGLLHMAACYGHEAIVKILVEQYSVNAMNIDRLGFVPGDYLRMALIRDMHHYSSLKAILSACEDDDFQRRKQFTSSLGSFIEAFDQASTDYLIGNRARNSGMVARDSSTLESASILRFLGNILPFPGASLAGEIGGEMADMMTENQEQAKRDQYFQNNPKELPREFQKLAYVLSQRYEGAIQHLSADGARELGKYCAGKVKEYLEEKVGAYLSKDATRIIDKNKSLTNQVLKYLERLPSRRSGFSTKVERQQGGTWKAKDILTGSNPEIPTTAWPPVRPYSIVDQALDQQEIMRLEVLLSNLSSDVVPLSISSLAISSTLSLSPLITSSIDQSPLSVGNVTSSDDNSVAVGIFGTDGKVGKVSGSNGGLAGGVVVDEASTRQPSHLKATVGDVTANGGGNAYGVFVGNISMFLPKK